MFEEGVELKKKYGMENVYDFSLGNPNLDPPDIFFKNLNNLNKSTKTNIHGYMPNSGFESTRKAVANKISVESSSNLGPDDIIMTVGAAGAINVILHSILNPNEEVIIFKPFFPEYQFYVDNHQGVSRFCEFNENFEPSLIDFESIISEKTKAIILNSPNNPSGITYSAKTIKKIVEITEKYEKKFGIEIYIISDEPYRYLEYENNEQPFITSIFERGVIATSFSKDLSLAGERIGYLAVNPQNKNKKSLISALNFSNRTLGFVNAPAIAQRLVEKSINYLADIETYKLKRDLMYENLKSFGYEIVKPAGGFYLFPKSPIDDIEFCNLLKNEKILVVPGSGFGAPNHFRISYSVRDDVIENSLNGFKKVIQNFKN